MQLEFRGKHLEFLHDATPELLIEGSLSSGKTTVGIWKELEAAKKYPGIWILITRWTDDAVKTLLKPAIEQLARIHGTELAWNNAENYYAIPNGSRMFAFGLKTQSSDPLQKYSKIRGLPVSRILLDQAEQAPNDLAAELRFRLRPDIEARMKGIEYPRQLTFLANPVNDNHFLAKEFPISNKQKGRRLYSFSLLDNAHALPADMVESLYATYPPDHPFHATKILGERGLSVVGDAVYENLFERKVHVRPLAFREDMPALEALEVGKHNPVWVLAQRSYHGGVNYLGGIMGKGMMLHDFLPLVKSYRSEWLPADAEIKTCSGPMGNSTSGYTLIDQITAAHFQPIWRQDGNSPDVQLAMIEYLGGELRRRMVAREEAIGITNDPSRWLVAGADGMLREVPFLSFAFDGGYVWDSHMVSVNNKEVRQPYADDEYANAMRCVEHIALNFCAGHLTSEERQRRERQQRQDASFQGHSDALSEQGWMRS